MDDLLLKIEAVLWSPHVDSMPRGLRLAIYVVRFIYALIRDVVTTTLTLRAMGLVYITILSIVPLLALIFASLKGFGIHRSRIEPALLQILEPLGEKGVGRELGQLRGPEVSGEDTFTRHPVGV